MDEEFNFGRNGFAYCAYVIKGKLALKDYPAVSKALHKAGLFRRPYGALR